MNKVFATIISLLLVAVLAAQAFLFVKVYKMDAVLEELQSEEGQTEEEEKDEVIRLDTTVVKVDTPYALLKYPSEWVDQMLIETGENGDIYTVLFSTKIDGKNVPLFSVTFGDAEAQDQVGTIDHNGKKVPVAIMESLIEPSDWTAEQYQLLTQMMTAKETVKDSIFNK